MHKNHLGRVYFYNYITHLQCVCIEYTIPFLVFLNYCGWKLLAPIIIEVLTFVPLSLSLSPPRGAVAADGRIDTGDMLLEVNGVNFEHMTNDDAVRALREIVQQPG